MKLWYPIFDTMVFGNAVQAEQALFQVPQGGDTTHTKSFTNMRGAGAFPVQENFNVYAVGVFVDFNVVLPADLYNVWIGNYLELRVADQTMLQVPLRACAQYNSFNGHYSQAAAANGTLGGIQNDGYELKNPVPIKGGTAFRVNIPQATALSVASIPVRVILHGELDRP